MGRRKALVMTHSSRTGILHDQPAYGTFIIRNSVSAAVPLIRGTLTAACCGAAWSVCSDLSFGLVSDGRPARVISQINTLNGQGGSTTAGPASRLSFAQPDRLSPLSRKQLKERKAYAFSAKAQDARDGVEIGAGAAAASASTSHETRELDPDAIATLLKHGEELIAAGDIAAARVLLRRAAEARDAQAALTLGATYDPLALQKLGVRGVFADIAMARSWYEKAKEFGSAEGQSRLELLASQYR
jgi:hypothetical protein